MSRYLANVVTWSAQPLVSPKILGPCRIGVYLTSIMFHEDKVLLTNEDLLPILEVQQDVPSSANLQVQYRNKVLLTNEDLLPILEVQQDVPSSANLQVPVP